MKQHPVGLVCAGGVIKSWLAKRRTFLEVLGPVKATGLRVASRMANSLRAGRAVESYKALSSCSMIFVAVPPANLPTVLDELAAAEIGWQGKTIVVVDGNVDSADLRAFEVRQASSATLDLIDASPQLRLAVQGDSKAVKALRKLFEREGVRLFEISPGAKAAYQAGLTLAVSAAAPLLAASIECFVAAGLDLPQAQAVADLSMNRARRAFLKAGKKGWMGTLSTRDREGLMRQWERLRRTNPALAEYFLATAASSAEYLSGESSWIEPHSDLQPQRTFRRLATGD
jgi:predicted short-subunit dehydrogenase-like oxidoreductase (DUF2520 family)